MVLVVGTRFSAPTLQHRAGPQEFLLHFVRTKCPSLDGTLGWAHLRCVPFSHPQEPTVPPKMEQLYPSVWTATCPGGSLYYPQLSLKFQISLPLSFLSCSSSDCMPAPPGPTEFPLSSVMDAGVETALGKDNVYF